jgi:hypothetical protein
MSKELVESGMFETITAGNRANPSVSMAFHPVPPQTEQGIWGFVVHRL